MYVMRITFMQFMWRIYMASMWKLCIGYSEIWKGCQTCLSYLPAWTWIFIYFFFLSGYGVLTKNWTVSAANPQSNHQSAASGVGWCILHGTGLPVTESGNQWPRKTGHSAETQPYWKQCHRWANIFGGIAKVLISHRGFKYTDSLFSL